MVSLLGSERHEWSKNISLSPAENTWKWMTSFQQLSIQNYNFLETASAVYSLPLNAIAGYEHSPGYKLQKSSFLTRTQQQQCILFAWLQSLGVVSIETNCRNPHFWQGLNSILFARMQSLGMNVSLETNCRNSCYWHGHSNKNKILFTWMQMLVWRLP